MAFSQSASMSIIIPMTVLFMFTVCFAEVYKVGDDSGWVPEVNYTAWAFPKHFHVDDVVVFVYDKRNSNVVRVPDRRSFHTCNTTRALATYSTGNDSVTIVTPGHHYFISAVNNRCDPMQRLDVNVYNHGGGGSSQVPVPAPASSPASPSKKSDAPARVRFYSSFLGVIAFALFMLI